MNAEGPRGVGGEGEGGRRGGVCLMAGSKPPFSF